MTECNGGPVEEFGDRYLTGGLSESDAERFEDHYLGCEVCHEILSALHQIQEGLQNESAEHAEPAESPKTFSPQPMRIVSRRSEPVRVLKPTPRMIAWGSLAAAILLAALVAGVGLRYRQQQQSAATHSTPQSAVPAPKTDQPKPEPSPLEPPPTPQEGVLLATLADRHLPYFRIGELRGSDGNDASHVAFQAGMKSYQQGDCRSALSQLQQVAAESQDAVAARLYTGLCQFKGRELMKAQVSFEKVIAAGDTPQLEAAEYFLAQTMLLRSDASSARNWLHKTIALHGDYQTRAQTQLSLLVQRARQPWRAP
jgi:hypothetical protein